MNSWMRAGRIGVVVEFRRELMKFRGEALGGRWSFEFPKTGQG